MGSKKIKIQLEDADGGKYDLALQGNISKTKIIKFIEVLDLLEIEGKDPDFEDNIKVQRQGRLYLTRFQDMESCRTKIPL